MKKIILPILMTILVLLSLRVPALAASSQPIYNVKSYREVNKTTLTKGKYYLISKFFYSSGDLETFYDLEEGVISPILCAETLDEELKYLNYRLPDELIAKIRGCHYDFSEQTNDFTLYFLYCWAYSFAPSANDVAVSEAYELEIEKLPTINSEDVHEINYDNLIDLATIKARYKATDNYDKDITNKIRFETNYPTDLALVKVGEYYITASVVDSSNNKTSVTNKIIVVDTTAPVFSGTLSYILNYGEAFSVDTILNGLSCKDNYEKTITKDKFVVDGSYNSEKLGSQFFTVSYRDKSGNLGSCRVEVKIVDNEAPIITVIDTIKISTTNRLNEAEIIKMLVDSNKISSDYKSAEIESEYFNTDIEGIYTSLCKVTNKDDSVNYYRFKIDLSSAYSPVEDSEKTNLWLIVGTSVAVVFVGISVGVFFYIRHRKALSKLQ